MTHTGDDQAFINFIHVTVQEARDQVAKELAEYGIPAIMVNVDDLPDPFADLDIPFIGWLKFHSNKKPTMQQECAILCDWDGWAFLLKMVPTKGVLEAIAKIQGSNSGLGQFACPNCSDIVGKRAWKVTTPRALKEFKAHLENTYGPFMEQPGDWTKERMDMLQNMFKPDPVTV